MGNLGGCGMDGGGIFEISYTNKFDRILLLHVPQSFILNEKGRSVHLQDDRPSPIARLSLRPDCRTGYNKFLTLHVLVRS
jgi:hypothetical protein